MIDEIWFLKIREVGRIVERKAQRKEVSSMTMNTRYGKVNLIGKSVKSARYMLIVKPINIPTTEPMMQLLNTRVKASKK